MDAIDRSSARLPATREPVAISAPVIAFPGSLGGLSATTCGMYLDGLRWMPNQLSGRFDPYGLESIDVLKGPASVLYGQGTPGGLIDMVSKKPTEQALREVQLEYGSFDHRQIKADLSGPLAGSSGAEAPWLYRVTALAHDNLTQVDFTSDKRVFIAPGITWRPVAGTELTLLGSYQHDTLGSFYPFLPAQGTVLPNPNGAIRTGFFSGDPDFNTYSRTQYALGYRFATQVGDVWTLRQNFRYNRFQLNAANLFDRIYVAGCYSATGCSYGDRRNIIGSVRYQW